MSRVHHYNISVEWTGNNGSGTSNAAAYRRDHTLSAANRQPLACSSDPAFRGDPTKYNPEDMLLYSLSSCHMLWYLHLCADAGVIVTAYTDYPEATMVEESAEGEGRFINACLKPVITITNASMQHLAHSLHEKAHHKCFIANSCNFPVTHEPTFVIAAT